jgi:DNA (cytosine-5)-methyltransferase 1
MSAYYNENDQFCCAWISNLMDAGMITPGVIDDRSIEDLNPDELRGYKRAHFFAGIAVWDYALNQAGWPDDSATTWTGSCPCQGFSASGQRGGFSDKRHLWPTWFRLIRECRPDTIFGEQVASKDGLAWLDVVSADVENAGYAIGTVDTCAAGVGAPHIRQRLYFVADSQSCDRRLSIHEREPQQARTQSLRRGAVSRMAQPCSEQNKPATARGFYADPCSDSPASVLEYPADNGHARRTSEESIESQGTSSRAPKQRSGITGKLGDSEHAGYDRSKTGQAKSEGYGQERRIFDGAGFTNGLWRDAEWIYCRDEKWRAVEPSTFPLAHGTTNRVGRLRGYGNAINAQVAQAFIESYLEIC